MMNSRLLSLATCTALLLLGSSTSSVAVTITNGGVIPTIIDASTGIARSAGQFGASDHFATLSLGEFQSQCERFVSGYSITHDLQQMREGDLGDRTSGYVHTNIRVDVPTPYSIFGSFTNSAGQTYMNTSLYDQGHEFLFSQTISTVANTSYTAVVNRSNYGASGMLLPGHIYRFSTIAHTQTSQDTDDGATASGSFTLQFGNPDVEMVPEPASIAVWSCLGLGAVGMTWVRRRKVLSSSAS